MTVSPSTCAKENDLVIRSLESPDRIVRGGLFQVKAVVDFQYAEALETKVNIYEGKGGEFERLVAESRPDSLKGSGTREFALNVTATKRTGPWQLTLYALRWLEDGPDGPDFYYMVDGGFKEFTITVLQEEEWPVITKLWAEPSRLYLNGTAFIKGAFSYNFTAWTEVKISAYSGRLSEHFPLTREEMLLGEERIRLLGNGTRSFQIQVNAPDKPSAWSVTVIASVYGNPGTGEDGWWFNDRLGGAKELTIEVAERGVIPSFQGPSITAAALAGVALAAVGASYAVRRRRVKQTPLTIQLGAAKRYCINCAAEITTDALYCPRCAPGLDKPPEVELQAVQATLSVKKLEVRVGETIDLNLDIVNATEKGPITLIRVEDIIPQGVPLVSGPPSFRIVGEKIELRGKRLDPMKAVELDLKLVPAAKGVFALKPRVLYLDEKGVLKLTEMNATTILVKELGLREWMMGKR
ncbi:MAG: hypothetical protein QW390_03475 [Candidatus Bathyarchaeia archaeon]